MKITEKFILQILSQRHLPKEWIFLTQVRSQTGRPIDRVGGLQSLRYIDAFALHLWPSHNHLRVAYEVKTDRGDFLKELEDPTKRAYAYLISHKFYFALAEGVGKPRDLYKRVDTRGCGLLRIRETGEVEELIRAPIRKPLPLPEYFIASMLRNARDNGRFNLEVTK